MDTTYFLRPIEKRVVDDVLQESIRKYGILHPPLLQKITEKRYQIVSGRKRIAIAKKLSMQKITALLVNDGVGKLNLWELLIEHAQTGNQLSIIEQATLLHKAAKTLDKEEILPLLPLLGHKAQAFMLGSLSAFLLLDPLAITGLHNGSINAKTGSMLSKLSHADQREAAQMIFSLHLGGSKQKKFIDFTIELLRRKKQPLSLLLAEWKEGNMEDGGNIPQQAASLLHWLHGKCFPRSGAAEKAFSDFNLSLNLPKDVSLEHASSFEDDRCILSVTFADKGAVKNKIEKILDLIDDKKNQEE